MNPKPSIDNLPHAHIKRQPKFPLVWIIPVLAAVAAAWLVIVSVRQMGPLITITFVNGNGLQANQTTLKYHGVRIGEVVSVDLAKDLQQVVVRARLRRSAAGVARAGSLFWVVRPEVGTGGLHGLETIVSGPYIEVQPGGSGDKIQKNFTGVEEAPPDNGQDGKFEVILTTPQISTLSVGSSVYYRGIEVGTVSDFVLNDDSRLVNIHLFIETNFMPLIRANTKFWNAGGISVRLKMLGINVSAENFKSLIIGGIAFATPTEAGPTVPSGTTFPLYTRSENAWLNWSPAITLTNARVKGNSGPASSMLLDDINPPEK